MTAQEQEAIFRRWLDEHVGLMLKVVRGCAAAPQDQDDLFQEVLLNVWSSNHGIDGLRLGLRIGLLGCLQAEPDRCAEEFGTTPARA